MVVQCTNCNSRFRVADERVPDKGVKVRCTKCSTVFRVTRADAIDAKPAAAPAEQSPLPETPPPVPDNPAPRAGSGVPPPVSFTYGAASPDLSLDFDLGAPPPAPVPPPRPAPAPRANPIMNAIDAALDAALDAPDPFGNLDQPAPGLPGLPSLGMETPKEEIPQGPSSIDLFGDRDAGDRLAAAMANLDLEPPAPPPPAPAPFPSFSDLAPPPSMAAPEFQRAPPREETDPFAGLDSPQSYGMPAAPQAAPEPPPPRELTREPTAGPPVTPELGVVPSSAREIDLPESTQSTIDLAVAEERTAFARIAPIKAMAGQNETPRPKLDPKTATQQRLRKEFASALLNVISAALVCYAGIVAIAVIRTPRPIGFQDLGFTVVWLAFGAESVGHSDTVRALNVNSGVYQTNTGDEMFYLQGSVQNDTSRRHEAMYVTLELKKGSQVLDRAEAIVGLHASPEDLYNLSSRKNEDLQALLSQRAKTTALEPHRTASFVGVFDLSARDLAGTSVSIEVHEGVPPAQKAVNPPRKADATKTPPVAAAQNDPPAEAAKP